MDDLTFFTINSPENMEVNEENVTQDWETLQLNLAQHFGKKPDLKAILFLIGVQELGQGVHHFSKEQKQDLIHIAICRVLSPIGVYALKGRDEDGWPHWELQDKLPNIDFFSQERLLKTQVIAYFKENQLF